MNQTELNVTTAIIVFCGLFCLAALVAGAVFAYSAQKRVSELKEDIEALRRGLSDYVGLAQEVAIVKDRLSRKILDMDYRVNTNTIEIAHLKEADKILSNKVSELSVDPNKTQSSESISGATAKAAPAPTPAPNPAPNPNSKVKINGRPARNPQESTWKI